MISIDIESTPGKATQTEAPKNATLTATGPVVAERARLDVTVITGNLGHNIGFLPLRKLPGGRRVDNGPNRTSSVLDMASLATVGELRGNENVP